MVSISIVELKQLMESPLFILLITISIPLAVFFVMFFKTVIPRVTRPRSTQVTQTSVAQQAQPQQTVNNKDKELEELLKTLINRMDKYQNDLVNTLNTSIEDLKQTLQKLNSSIEDTVLSLKSIQADSTSPFNVISEQIKNESTLKPETGKELKAVAEIVGTTNIDLSSFIRNCVLLEVLEYDDSKLTALYELGYISADDMYIVNKIQSYIRNNSGKIRAKELAGIAMNVAESYSSVTAEMKKYLLVLEVNRNDK
ncbi:hypothetical protein V6M85_04885 [Sulfolobus tengchongensis]|uniref:Uncharacterized protein n=1 Tax=Sulfolobus tengchongensis TaxID=207809 RepID=A0AAX4L375_9CREN